LEVVEQLLEAVSTLFDIDFDRLEYIFEVIIASLKGVVKIFGGTVEILGE
jgi:hypothetical protein